MSERAKFRRDLYGGPADYYDKFRLGYPEAMLADLASRVGLDGSGDLLDVACGTGQVAFALAPHVASIVGIDQEPDTVNQSRGRPVLAINDTSLTLSTGATALRRGDILGGTKQID